MKPPGRRGGKPVTHRLSQVAPVSRLLVQRALGRDAASTGNRRSNNTEGAMLVLSRKRSERIVIGSSILITVVKVDGNQVRLGIEAPGTCPIVRAELLSPQPSRPESKDRDRDFTPSTRRPNPAV